jgi:hypothetical protein
MFEVNETYANRKGNYTVLSVDAPRMTVRYEDGTTAELNMNIQARIWENIQSEQEARRAIRAARERRENGAAHYIKSLSMEAEEDLTLPGWRERVTVVEESGPELRPGDRIIYYAVEDRVFFAVATVTGEVMDSVPKGFFYSEEEARTLRFYPIDLDEHAYDIHNAVKLDAVDLESEPQFRTLLQKPALYLKVSEDDFELLAELLTEVTEEENTDYEDEEEEEEEEFDE